MKAYCNKVIELVKRSQRIYIQAIRRKLNVEANELANGATYGEYKKNKEITAQNDCPTDINLIESVEEA